MAKRAPGRISYMGARMIGDWSGVEMFFDNLGIEVKKKTEQAQWEICKKLRDAVIRHILAQDLGWQKLSKRTRNAKGSDLIYIDTQTYLNNIKAWKVKGQAFVGVKRGIIYKRKSGNVNLERVAIWMEYGTSRMPARPVWGPSIEELGGKKGIRDYVAAAIYRRLKWLARGKPIAITQKGITKLVK